MEAFYKMSRLVAREPIKIYDQAMRAAGVFLSDRMVKWTEGSRLLLKVESSLDQIVQIQATGNIFDNRTLTTNIGPPIPCLANGNISIGLAWDDWQPFVGVIITLAAVPTTGILRIWAVIQEQADGTE